MKKTILLLISILLFVPTIVNAAQCDTSKVYIDSIKEESNKGYAIELEDASAKDKIVNLNLRMSYKDDEILYKLVLKNDSNEDYEINKNNIDLNTDYIEYTLESDDSNIIKANSTKTIYLRVKYKNEVDQSKFVNGIYQDNVTMRVNLKSDDTPANPKTGISYIIIFSLILLISGLSLIIYKKKKLSTLMILVGLILLPIGVKALCTCDITIESKVKIQTEDQARLIYYSCFGKYDEVGNYKMGMTFQDLFDSYSSNNQDIVEEMLESGHYVYGVVDNSYFDCVNSIVYPKEEDYPVFEDYSHALNAAEAAEELCYTNHSHSVDFSDKIVNKDEGAYVVIFTGACVTY